MNINRLTVCARRAIVLTVVPAFSSIFDTCVQQGPEYIVFAI